MYCVPQLKETGTQVHRQVLLNIVLIFCFGLPFIERYICSFQKAGFQSGEVRVTAGEIYSR